MFEGNTVGDFGEGISTLNENFETAMLSSPQMVTRKICNFYLFTFGGEGGWQKINFFTKKSVIKTVI